MTRAVSLATAREAGLNNELADLPTGNWRSRLVAKAWGKSVNLICYFDNLETGQKHRISAFRSRDGEKKYTAKDGVVDFSVEGNEGKVYVLETGVNSKGNPAWLSAKEETPA